MNLPFSETMPRSVLNLACQLTARGINVVSPGLSYRCTNSLLQKNLPERFDRSR
jgi:hypothetical protein